MTRSLSCFVRMCWLSHACDEPELEFTSTCLLGLLNYWLQHSRKVGWQETGKAEGHFANTFKLSYTVKVECYFNQFLIESWCSFLAYILSCISNSCRLPEQSEGSCLPSSKCHDAIKIQVTKIFWRGKHENKTVFCLKFRCSPDMLY